MWICRKRTGARRFLLAVLVSLPACRADKPPDYRDESGVRFAPPPGWVERDRPALTSSPTPRRDPNLPLPHLDSAHKERLLVRYDRLTAGQLAWMRVSVANLSDTAPLERYLATHVPGTDWQREGEVETLEVNGKPAVRVAWKGRWMKLDYLCETTALRHGDELYLFTASFPADDATAREQTRQAVNAAVVP